MPGVLASGGPTVSGRVLMPVTEIGLQWRSRVPHPRYAPGVN